MTITGSLARGLVAGICAGLLAALFAFVVAEPTINRSIALEEQRAAATATANSADHPDPVSRDVQRRVGAPAGFILVGAALGVVFGLVYAGLLRFTAEGPPWRRVLSLAAAGVGALVVVPFLRYPPNPPGVGLPATVNERTRYYLAALLLGMSVVAFAWRLLRSLTRRGWPESQRQIVAAVAAVCVVGVGYLAMPSTSDPILVPAKLLWDFRIQSLATQLVLWGGLTAVFGLMTERDARSA